MKGEKETTVEEMTAMKDVVEEYTGIIGSAFAKRDKAGNIVGMDPRWDRAYQEIMLKYDPRVTNRPLATKTMSDMIEELSEKATKLRALSPENIKKAVGIAKQLRLPAEAIKQIEKDLTEAPHGIDATYAALQKILSREEELETKPIRSWRTPPEEETPGQRIRKWIGFEQ